MKNFIYLTLFILLAINNKAFSQIEIIGEKVLALKGNSALTPQEKMELETLYNAIKLYKTFDVEEKELNGKAQFGFRGNESDINNIFNINAGVEIDNGLYPIELDLKANFQTLIKKGKFEENISDIDISLDYQPKMGGKLNGLNGLWFENFIFLSRFNNTYIGVDQRYETGTGIILNFFTFKHLNKKGKKNKDKLEELPEYKLQSGNLWKCYDDACNKFNSSLKLTDDEVESINDLRYNNYKGNLKKYSTLRIAFLFGIYYENEKAKAENELFFNGVDSLFLIDNFNATNKLRLELRPTLVYKPNEIITIKFYPYFKYNLRDKFNEVRFDEDTFDRRKDNFYDIQASISAKISKKISFGIEYRYFKDFAPNRKYVVNNLNEPVLIVGQETNSYYNATLSIGF